MKGTASACLLLAAAAILAGAARHAGAQSCRVDCADEWLETFAAACPACHAIEARENCRERVEGDFSECTDGCPGSAGRCKLSRDCLNGCRAARARGYRLCDRRLRRTARRECAAGRECLGQARAARAACIDDCRRTPGVPLAASPLAPDPCNCQGHCIRRIVGSCYYDCERACEHDRLALALCRRACRDVQCDRLERACTFDEEGGGRGGDGVRAYRLCCAACGNCEDEVDCMATTTSTKTTTTTSTSAASTTTTSTLSGLR